MRHTDEGELAARRERALAVIDPAGEEEGRWSAARSRTGPAQGVSVLACAASVLLAFGVGWFARGLQPEGTPVAVAAPGEPRPVAEGGAVDEPAATQDAVSAHRLAESGVMSTPTAAAPDDRRVPLPRIAAGEASLRAARYVSASRRAPGRAGGAASLVIAGRVLDLYGRGVPDAQVVVPVLERGVMSDREGNYALVIPAAQAARHDTLTVLARSLGWRAQSRQVPVSAGGVEAQNFQLSAEPLARDGLVTAGLPRPPRERIPSPFPTPRRRVQPDTTPRPWTNTDVDGAAEWLGHHPLLIPDLPVLEMERGTLDGKPVVRVLQRLESGAPLRLVQRPAAADSAAQSVVELTEGIMVRRGELQLSAYATLPADLLQALLERLRCATGCAPEETEPADSVGQKP